MIHIALLLLLSSCCITPMYASPNYYAVLADLDDTNENDTLDTSASQHTQDENNNDDAAAFIEKQLVDDDSSTGNYDIYICKMANPRAPDAQTPKKNKAHRKSTLPIRKPRIITPQNNEKQSEQNDATQQQIDLETDWINYDNQIYLAQLQRTEQEPQREIILPRHALLAQANDRALTELLNNNANTNLQPIPPAYEHLRSRVVSSIDANGNGVISSISRGELALAHTLAQARQEHEASSNNAQDDNE
jgi:hypothetical protein